MFGVYIACPTYSEELHSGAARGLWLWASQRDDVKLHGATKSGSLIPGSCNKLWCDAMNARERLNLRWFAMLHADITPEPYWLDTLIAEAERQDADMIAAVVPLKDDRGITSTAIASDDETNPLCRLTQRQVWHQDFPDTFDIDQCAAALELLPDGLRIDDVPRVGLRLNTGCMAVRMDRPWVGCDPPQVWFDNPYWIERHNVQWRPRDVSEDWRFSQRVQEAGGKLVATRKVKLIHNGMATYPNDSGWGKCNVDPAMAAAKEMLCK